MNEDIPGNIHRRFYHKSDKVNAPENQNPEFQAGYWAGVASVGFNATKVIEEERALRKAVKDDLRKGFSEWKRGFWASRSQIVIFPIKKRPKCYGKFLEESSDKI
jgi:hypothetical protein